VNDVVIPPGLIVNNYAGAGGFTIKADSGAGGSGASKYWTFNPDGSMTTPGLLKSGNIQVGTNIYGSAFYGISTAIQLRPNIDVDKRFLFTVDSSGGNYIRSGMEMPMAEVDKAVTLAFPHDNSTAGYIFNQGTDTNGTEWNNALVIFQNGGNVKIGTITGINGNKVWEFNQTGNLILPQTNMNASPAPVSLPGITYTDGTFQTTAYTGAAATVDILNTNGLSNTFYPTFVEFRTTGQYVRADVDFTYRSDSNTLTVPKIAGILQGNVDHAGGYINFTGSPSPVSTGITFADGTSQTTAWTGFSPNITTPTMSGATKMAGVHEKFSSFASVSGIVSLDASTSQIFYITSPDDNWTPNLLNLNLTSTYATAVTFVISQGATAYYPNALQIGGVAQTINWQGNQTPTPTANRVDTVTFSIFNNSGTYTVLGQMTGF